MQHCTWDQSAGARLQSICNAVSLQVALQTEAETNVAVKVLGEETEFFTAQMTQPVLATPV